MNQEAFIVQITPSWATGNLLPLAKPRFYCGRNKNGALCSDWHIEGAKLLNLEDAFGIQCEARKKGRGAKLLRIKFTWEKPGGEV